MTGDKECCKMSNCFKNLLWWSKMTVAVLAIPSLAIIITSATQVSGAVEIVIFVLACWACTYLGMSLMKQVDKKDK